MRITWGRLGVAMLALACALGVGANPAEARGLRKKVRRHAVVPRPDPLRVTPSEDIEACVRKQIETSAGSIDSLTTDNLFDDPYLISALYYHQGFLGSYPEDRPDMDPSRRIIAHLIKLLTPDRKARIIQLLHEVSERGGMPFELVAPLPAAETRRSRRSHKYAVDLFAPEGTSVSSISYGVVALAESTWKADDVFSTTSRQGGNTVIIFDPGTDRFYRYCHLDQVLLRPGMLVEAGEEIGTVGHTGVNASRPRHGRHLHLEVNQYTAGGVRSYDRKQITAVLRTAKPNQAVHAALASKPVKAPGAPTDVSEGAVRTLLSPVIQ